MKKFIKILLFCVFIFIAVFLITSHYTKDKEIGNIDIKNNSLNYSVIYKGLIGAQDFAIDNVGNHYIAYKNRIQIIESDGKSYDILKDQNLDIFSIDYFDSKLYYSSGTKVYCYDLKSKKNAVIIKDMPNYGDYKNSMIKIRGDYLYIAIGSATNSGVVGDDNKWTKENFYAHDITPKDITLKGINFGVDKTGAFQSYRTKSIKGQIIPEHFPGNSSIIIYNLKTGNSETFAWGIRNITGMDFNSESKLISSVGGMENRGIRPIIGDTDYIYEIKKGVWYGWPDYSGGDPVNSPKFKSNKGISTQFILENHPTTNPPAPLYQHKAVSSIEALAVDSSSILGEKNCIYFYDKSDNVVYGFSGAGAVKEYVKFNSNSLVSNIKFGKSSLLILDGKNGLLYSIEKNNISNNLRIDKNLYFYLLATTIFAILVLLKIQKE
ncbi:PQQ-dependent sugar dehydrogenase [Clostridium sp. A1-XYC3]|uniref:PQQ-dependent sugar dehydrogenase n=1 Tax=Clostridium tanneri TaxID=3037988 RepID=A0ABU4JU89_9CLOT|nr:hypothetical protein [Clostridium sp. A1-XYC3]MDW8801708.1 PQQ-dependent sugar dehydrogenase [Clostridium sp. A1-XYC3]